MNGMMNPIPNMSSKAMRNREKYGAKSMMPRGYNWFSSNKTRPSQGVGYNLETAENINKIPRTILVTKMVFFMGRVKTINLINFISYKSWKDVYEYSIDDSYS